MPIAPLTLRAAAAAAALTLSITAAATAAPPTFDGPTIKNPQLAPDFVLRDQSGNIVRLSRLRGTPVLLTFLYTHCPDACPLTAARLNGALEEIGVDRSRVHVLAVSVDPRRDTHQAIAAFVRSHHLLPEFRYLTGTVTTLATVWREYGITTQPSGGALDHTLYTLLIDSQGRGRVLYDSTAISSEIAHDLRIILTTR